MTVDMLTNLERQDLEGDDIGRKALQTIDALQRENEELRAGLKRALDWLKTDRDYYRNLVADELRAKFGVGL